MEWKAEIDQYGWPVWLMSGFVYCWQTVRPVDYFYGPDRLNLDWFGFSIKKSGPDRINQSDRLPKLVLLLRILSLFFPFWKYYCKLSIWLSWNLLWMILVLVLLSIVPSESRTHRLMWPWIHPGCTHRRWYQDRVRLEYFTVKTRNDEILWYK